MFNEKLLIFPTQVCCTPYHSISISGNSNFPVAQIKNLGVIFNSFLSFTLHNQSVHQQLLLIYVQRVNSHLPISLYTPALCPSKFSVTSHKGSAPTYQLACFPCPLTRPPPQHTHSIFHPAARVLGVLIIF